MYVNMVKENNVHLHTAVGRTINKLFHETEKYKIRSYIIYLPESQALSPLNHGGEKLGLNFFRALTMQTTLI